MPSQRSYERTASGVILELDAWLQGLAERLRDDAEDIAATVRHPVVEELNARFEDEISRLEEQANGTVAS
jgi:hypothetical protein